MKGVYLALLNDKVDPAYAAPLIKMWVDGIDSRIDIRQSGAMEVMATIHTIDMNAYNNELAAFEPVIEPWGLMVDVRSLFSS
jgi:glutamate racemase